MKGQPSFISSIAKCSLETGRGVETRRKGEKRKAAEHFENRLFVFSIFFFLHQLLALNTAFFYFLRGYSYIKLSPCLFRVPSHRLKERQVHGIEPSTHDGGMKKRTHEIFF